MLSKKLPQLRVLVTDYCAGKCIYCRPSGEGNLPCLNREMKYSTAISVAKIYRALGGKEIKISGGDPVFWFGLCDYVKELKNTLRFEHVEVITRSPTILDSIESLSGNNLDLLNFSLDSLEPERYRKITGKNDFQQYIEAIINSATKIPCKINMVVLHDTSLEEIDSMMNFCIEHHIRELKLLDYIDGLNGKYPLQNKNQAEQFSHIYEKLTAFSERKIVYQGGFGHPMSQFAVAKDFCVVCKDANFGSWYSDCCLQCANYPCHDALMAIRVTPTDSFQVCLLNKNLHWKFNAENMESQFHAALSIYDKAFFKGIENEDRRSDSTQN